MIDISIVTYNSDKWLNKYFKSLCSQNYPISQIRVHITDNGSTDKTLEICKKIAQQNSFANFHIESKDNLGFGCGHNNNFKNCISEFILVTNVDLEYEQDSISRLVEFASNDTIDVASWEMRQKPFEHPKVYNPITLETSWSSSACVLFRKSVIDEVGGYEPKIFMYGEDVEMSWRLRANGYKLKYYPKSVCWHYTYEESSFKKTQFLGSTLANLYLRVRYGTERQIKEGESAYRDLINSLENYDGQRDDLIKNFEKYKQEVNYFRNDNLNKSDVAKFVNIWDYEITRDGAFYEYKKHTQTQPLVSVLIRSYAGRGVFLNDAINSVLNQTYANFEIVVVEDGGDTLINIVKLFNDKRIKYYNLDKVGRCVTGNYALEKAIGEFCIFLDDDDYFYCDHLEILVSEINECNQSVKAVYANAFEIKTQVVKSGNDIISYTDGDYLLHNGYLQNFDRCRMWKTNYIPIQCILFSRTLYLEYGGFNVNLDNLEDWNLWTRYSSACDFKYIGKTTSIYRVPAEEKESHARLQKLDEYYAIALAEQKNITVNLNVEKLSTDFNRSVEFNVHEISRLTHEINSIYNSRSWKITKPIRDILNLLRRMKSMIK